MVMMGDAETMKKKKGHHLGNCLHYIFQIGHWVHYSYADKHDLHCHSCSWLPQNLKEPGMARTLRMLRLFNLRADRLAPPNPA